MPRHLYVTILFSLLNFLLIYVIYTFTYFSVDMTHLVNVQRRAHLYVGNLSPRVTEYMLTEIFAVAGPVQHVKIIPDKNYQHGGLNYGFVEYLDMRAAETALQTLNGRKIFDTEIRVNWAYQGSQNKEDTTGHYHVFVGDLSPEVNDEVLGKAFSAFGTLSDARVMWDMNSGKSRGYGFLAFRDKTDAEQAIATMNGEWLGSRAIRVNWANQKTQGPAGGAPGAPAARPANAPVGGSAPAPINFQGGPLSYDVVVQQTPAYNTTVYVGNLVPYCTQADLIPLFQSIGYLSEIRMQADRGFAFVKLDTHEHAAMAIVQLQGQMVHGRPIKCSWGKDRADASVAVANPVTPTAAAASPYGNIVCKYFWKFIDSQQSSVANVRYAPTGCLRTIWFYRLHGIPWTGGRRTRRRWPYVSRYAPSSGCSSSWFGS